MVSRVHHAEMSHETAHHRAPNHALDKTRLCHFFARGACSRGSKCTFAHGEQQLVPQPDLYHTGLCFDFMKTGVCRSGDACRFAHTSEQLRPIPAQPKEKSTAAATREAARVTPASSVTKEEGARRARREPPQVQKSSAGITRMRREKKAFSGAGRKALMGSHSQHHSGSEDGSEITACSSGRGATRGSELLSRQTSVGGSEDEWEVLSACGSFDSFSAHSASSAADLVADVGLAIVVRKTFLEVEPVAVTSAAPRRAKSAPATARCAGPTL